MKQLVTTTNIDKMIPTLKLSDGRSRRLGRPIQFKWSRVSTCPRETAANGVCLRKGQRQSTRRNKCVDWERTRCCERNRKNTHTHTNTKGTGSNVGNVQLRGKTDQLTRRTEQSRQDRGMEWSISQAGTESVLPTAVVE